MGCSLRFQGIPKQIREINAKCYEKIIYLLKDQRDWWKVYHGIMKAR